MVILKVFICYFLLISFDCLPGTAVCVGDRFCDKYDRLPNSLLVRLLGGTLQNIPSLFHSNHTYPIYLHLLKCVIFSNFSFQDPNDRLKMLFVGQILAACAQPVILSCPTVLAGAWFGENERAKANMIGSISNPIGIAIGQLMSSQLLPFTQTPGGSLEYNNADIRLILLINALLAVVSCFTIILFFQERPPSPPSMSAGQSSEGFITGFKSVICNKMYLILLVGFGMGMGATSAVSGLSGQIVGGQGFTGSDTGLFMVVLLVSGLFGALASGKVVDRTKRFTEVLKACFWMSTLSFVALTLLLKTRV